MKQNVLKKMIKDAVREAIQEEFKDILLEAIKAPKIPINESFPGVNIGSNGTGNVNTPPPTTNISAKYGDMMGALEDTKMSFTTQDIAPINPVGVDPINGSLPKGSVSLDQIGNLLKT